MFDIDSAQFQVVIDLPRDTPIAQDKSRDFLYHAHSNPGKGFDLLGGHGPVHEGQDLHVVRGTSAEATVVDLNRLAALAARGQCPEVRAFDAVGLVGLAGEIEVLVLVRPDLPVAHEDEHVAFP